MNQDPLWILAATTITSLIGNVIQMFIAWQKQRGESKIVTAEAKEIEARVLDARAEAELQFLKEALDLRRQLQQEMEGMREERRKELEFQTKENERLIEENRGLRARIEQMEKKTAVWEAERVELMKQLNHMRNEIYLWQYGVEGGPPIRKIAEE